MRVLFDHQIFEQQVFGGISRYHYELYTGLKQQSADVSLDVTYSNNDWLLRNNEFKHLKPYYDPIDRFISPRDFPFKRSLFKYWKSLNRSLTPSEEQKDRIVSLLSSSTFDIFHPTYYDPYFLEHLGDTKLVVTIHDLTHEKFPEYFIGDPYQLSKQSIIERADAIITVSNTTRNALKEYYPLLPSSIHTVYHGAFHQDLSTAKHPLNNPDRYLLYVGNRKGYKNFYFMLSALASVLRNEEITLICVGGEFDEYEVAFIDHLNISDHIKCTSVPDDQLGHLYENAIFLVIPSLDEGFGYPLLEAMIHKCPIVCSEIDIFREIIGDSALYFNPKVRSSIIKACMVLINDPSLRRTMVEKGLSRANFFSAESMLLGHEKVYKSLID